VKIENVSVWLKSLCLAMLFGLLSLGAAHAAEKRDFRSADTHLPDYPTVQAMQYMGKILSERTQGRLSITVFHSRQLGEETDTIHMSQAGAVDLLRISMSPFTDLIPETRVLTLPFLFSSDEHYQAVLNGPIGQEVLAAFEPHGFVGLAYYESGSRSFYTTKKPIKSLKDLKGLRIRVQNSDLIAATIEALGATPVKMSFGQVLTALETNIIDGAENNWPSYESTGHYKAAAHYSLSRHLRVPEVVVMSKSVWDTLSPDDQILIRQAALDSQQVMAQLWKERVDRARKTVEAANVQVYELEDIDAFQQAVKPVYDKFIRDPKLRDLVRRIRATKP